MVRTSEAGAGGTEGGGTRFVFGKRLLDRLSPDREREGERGRGREREREGFQKIIRKRARKLRTVQGHVEVEISYDYGIRAPHGPSF